MEQGPRRGRRSGRQAPDGAADRVRRGHRRPSRTLPPPRRQPRRRPRGPAARRRPPPPRRGIHPRDVPARRRRAGRRGARRRVRTRLRAPGGRRVRHPYPPGQGAPAHGHQQPHGADRRARSHQRLARRPPGTAPGRAPREAEVRDRREGMTMTTPTSTEPAALPHPNEDPAFAAARQAPVDYQTTVDKIRTDPRISDLGKAEKIAAAYETYTGAMQGAWDELQGRRQARHDWLAGQAPTGPAIPDDTTHADRAALMAAFRTNYAQAAETDRFGDESARRAVLTAILENSEIDTLQARRDRYATLAAHLDELTDLRRGGSTTVRGFQRQVFRMVDRPKEIDRIPELQAAYESRRDEWRRAGQLR